MNPETAAILARVKIEEHGLGAKGWTFSFDSAILRFGGCSYKNKRITLSRAIVEFNDEAAVLNMILHEIAHALTPGAHHSSLWRGVALFIGCDGARTHNAITPKANFRGTCLTCGKTYDRFRRSKTMKTNACTVCCRKAGGYRPKFILSWKRI